MNPVLALLGMEVRRRCVERETKNKEGNCIGGEHTWWWQIAGGVVNAIDLDQKALLRKLAQHFIHPASGHPPTVEIVELSDVFCGLLRDVVRRGAVVSLCEPTSDFCGLQYHGCTGERCAEPQANRNGLDGRGRNAAVAYSQGDEGRVHANTFAVASTKRVHCAQADQHPNQNNIPSFELWDAGLLNALRCTGDAVSRAHNEMLALLDALSDGRFPQLLAEECRAGCPSLWTKIVCFFEDAFEAVLRNVVQFLLWCIYQHLLGREGLAVHPLFTVKALWSYSSSGVITSPSPSELHDRLMQRVKKELIWILVPEFRLCQMTKRPISSPGLTKRPTLRSTFMEDAGIKRLWEAIHYTASQRCEELNNALGGLTDAYLFYFLHKEEYYMRLDAQRLREMVVAMRNSCDELVQSVGAGAFAVQTETLRQIVLDKLEPLLRAVQSACGRVMGCDGDSMVSVSWMALTDAQANILSEDALAKRLNAFRAGQKVNKYSKGLEPVAHTMRFLEAQRTEMTRLQQEYPLRVKSDGEQTKVKQSETNNSRADNGNITMAPAVKSLSKHARPLNATFAPGHSAAKTLPVGLTDERQDAVFGAASSACEEQMLLCRTRYGPQSPSQKSDRMEAAMSHSCDSSQYSASRNSHSLRFSDEVNATEKSAPTEHMILAKRQEQSQSSTNDVPVINMKGDTQQLASTNPDPVTTISSANMTLNCHICNSAAVDIATQRSDALRKQCPFLPDLPCPGVFLEDLNLSDSRLEAALNRLRAVRGNASVMRNYRMVAQVEDSVCALIETLAAELSAATLRMLSHYPFLETRLKGVLLGNISELEMDGDFQSLLKMRQQAEKEQKPTKNIDESLVERACVLASDIPYVVTYERYSAQPSLFFSPAVPPCASLPATLPSCDADNSCSNKLMERVKDTNTFAHSNLEPTSRRCFVQPEQTQSTTTYVKHHLHVTMQGQQQQPGHEASKVLDSAKAKESCCTPRTPRLGPSMSEAVVSSHAGRPADPLHLSPTASKEYAFLGTQPSLCGIRSPAVMVDGARGQNRRSVSLPPTLQGTDKQKKDSEYSENVTGKPLSTESCSVERHERSGVVHGMRLPTSCIVETKNNTFMDNRRNCSDSSFFNTVRSLLGDEREQLEHFELILKEVHNTVVSQEDGAARVTGTAGQATLLDAVNEKPKEHVQLTGGIPSLQGQHLKAPKPFAAAPNTTAETAMLSPALVSPPSTTTGDAVPLGPLFEGRHSAQAPRGSCTEEGGELLRRLIEERRKVSAAQRVREREQAIQKLRRLKGDVHSSSPSSFGSLADAVVKSSWGRVRKDPLVRQPQLLPSLSRGLLRWGVNREQQMSHELARQEPSRNQRPSLESSTAQQQSLLGVKQQRGPSSAPDISRSVEESLDLFPTISLKASTDNLPHTTQAPEWETISSIAVGMRQQYAALCRQAGIRPNSMLLRALPDTHGISVSRIDTSVNYIGPKGLAPLLHVLRCNIGLEYLNLSHNNLENDEIIDLVNVLMTESGASLRLLDLSNNPVSLAGGAALLRLAQARPSLQSIRLKGTLIPQQLNRSISEVCSSRHGDPH